MVEHAWSYIWDRQAESIEYNRKLMETYMKITDIVGDYDREFDMSALDRSTPWLPPAPVADTETSETRGIVEDTLTERGKNYGDFTDNAQISQSIKNIVHLYVDKHPVAIENYMLEAMDLIATKIGRLLSGNPYHVDGWHDIAGYATLVEQRLNKLEQK